jgi:predicted SprT family Zn-dependent metalloprotease
VGLFRGLTCVDYLNSLFVMNIVEALDRVRELMNEHDLHQWNIRLSNRRRQLGRCTYHTQTLWFSRHMIEYYDWDNVREVVLHEIAHALLSPSEGHSDIWLAKAQEIGCVNPARLFKNNPIPGRYRSTCPVCGEIKFRYRYSSAMNGRLYCAACGPSAVLTWTDTLTRVPKPSSVVATTQQQGDTMSSKTYSAPELAEQLGVDAKTLRRFLRENGSFRNPGSGARYTFTASEAKSVEKAFNSWRSGKSSAKTTNGAKPKSKTSDVKKRIDTLEAGLKAQGNHISQH